MAASSGGVGSKTELLNVLGEVKARVQEKLGIVGFPMPQFILIGKQSVGKSRLIEALAGECFNFISGSLGSRRPTVLEFRNVATHKNSKWFMRNRDTMKWLEMPIEQVMIEVGKAHEELGETVSEVPAYVRIESPSCVDMQIVDLPGFRDFALDEGKKVLQANIERLVEQFMRDKNNVMLCVEQAGDCSTMSTLERCRNIDPNFERTVLIRNKLDKYYPDLTSGNVNKWMQGFDDLPQDLNRPVRFALTLPFWKDGASCPMPFVQMREEKSQEDVRTLKSKNLAETYSKYVGFNAFANFMERKIEQMFSEAIGPVLTNLVNLKSRTEKDEHALTHEYNETDPQRILSTTRDCGVSFATALTHVMEGVLGLTPVMNLEDELKAFQNNHSALGSTHFSPLPSDDFAGLDDYINYLRNEIQVATFDVEVNGGAQFRRLMSEVEIFLRFSEIAVEVKKRDVIQARGVSMSSLTWRDVVVKLLSNEAHLPLQRRLGTSENASDGSS
jgi:GTP-binding protein EngB required for normal cell division